MNTKIKGQILKFKNIKLKIVKILNYKYVIFLFFYLICLPMWNFFHLRAILKFLCLKIYDERSIHN